MPTIKYCIALLTYEGEVHEVVGPFSTNAEAEDALHTFDSDGPWAIVPLVPEFGFFPALED